MKNLTEKVTDNDFNLRALTGNHLPHPDYKGWRGFLNTCEVRGEEDGVIFYGKTNCNYILFPDGTIIENYAFWGENLMSKIKQKGAAVVLAEIKAEHRKFLDILNGVQPLS